MSRRVVFDTTTVVSALAFEVSRLTWLREHWRLGCTPLVSTDTTLELTRVLAYAKFKLTFGKREDLLGMYLPYCGFVDVSEQCLVRCRDVNDQPFLDLAQSGRADVLVSGDKDLLALQGQLSFAIKSPQTYALRVH